MPKPLEIRSMNVELQQELMREVMKAQGISSLAKDLFIHVLMFYELSSNKLPIEVFTALNQDTVSVIARAVIDSFPDVEIK